MYALILIKKENKQIHNDIKCRYVVYELGICESGDEVLRGSRPLKVVVD